MTTAPHVTAIDSDRHAAKGCSVATANQILKATAADVQTFVSMGGDVTGAPDALQVTDLSLAGSAWGDIAYRNNTNWVRLPAGTLGYVLTTSGVGANPSWVVGPPAALPLLLTDDTASIPIIQEGSNNYVRAVTTNGGESLDLMAHDLARDVRIGLAGSIIDTDPRLEFHGGTGGAATECAVWFDGSLSDLTFEVPATGSFNMKGTGVNSTMVGLRALCGLRSVVVGWTGFADQDRTTVVGYNADGGGAQRCVGIGSDVNPSSFCVCVGDNSDAASNYTTLVGYQTIGGASAANAIALGALSEVAHDRTVAVGTDSVTTAIGQIVWGSSGFPYTSCYWGEGVTSILPGDFTHNATSSDNNTNNGGSLIWAPGKAVAGAGAVGGELSWMYVPVDTAIEGMRLARSGTLELGDAGSVAAFDATLRWNSGTGAAAKVATMSLIATDDDLVVTPPSAGAFVVDGVIEFHKDAGPFANLRAQDQSTVDAQATSVFIIGGEPGLVSVANGKPGGEVRLQAAPGADGDATFPAGAGGEIGIFAADAGTAAAGGGNNGGSVTIGVGSPSGTGIDGQIKLNPQGGSATGDNVWRMSSGSRSTTDATVTTIITLTPTDAKRGAVFVKGSANDTTNGVGGAFFMMVAWTKAGGTVTIDAFTEHHQNGAGALTGFEAAASAGIIRGNN